MIFSKKMGSMAFILNAMAAHGSNQPDNLSLQKIENWEQAAKFRGAIVAYKASSYYLSGKAHSVDGKQDLYYAFLDRMPSTWSDGEIGCNMQRLLEKGAIHGSSGLVDSRIKEADLFMRLATAQEKKCICESLNKGIAEFDYMFFNEKMIRTELGCPKAS